MDNEIELIWENDLGKGDIKEPTQSGNGDGFHIDLTPSGVKKAAEAYLTGKSLRLNTRLHPIAFRIHFPELIK